MNTLIIISPEKKPEKLLYFKISDIKKEVL